MNNFCVDLNLNIFPIRNSIESIVHDGNKISLHKKITIDYISPELIDLFNRFELMIDLCENFYTPAFQKSKIHSDSEHYLDDFIKINFIFGGRDSTMNWYNIKNNIVGKKLKTGISTDYILYDENDVERIFTAQVKFPSLIQAGIPHNIENLSEPRYCLSIIPSMKGKKISMQQGIEIFKEYLTNPIDSI
jgi:hypothetical protein